MTFARVLALAVLVASPLAAFAEEAQYGAEEAVMMDSEASVQADAGVAMPDGEGEKLEDYMMKAPADVAGDGKAAGEIAADAAATTGHRQGGVPVEGRLGPAQHHQVERLGVPRCGRAQSGVHEPRQYLVTDRLRGEVTAHRPGGLKTVEGLPRTHPRCSDPEPDRRPVRGTSG